MTGAQKSEIKKIFSTTQWIIEDNEVAEVCVVEILEAGNRDGVVRINLQGRTRPDDKIEWRNSDREYDIDELYPTKIAALEALRRKYDTLIANIDSQIRQTYKDEEEK